MKSLLVIGSTTDNELRKHFNIANPGELLQDGVEYADVKLMSTEMFAYMVAVKKPEFPLTDREIVIPQRLAISQVGRTDMDAPSDRYASLLLRNVDHKLTQLRDIDYVLCDGDFTDRSIAGTGYDWMGFIEELLKTRAPDEILSIYRVNFGTPECFTEAYTEKRPPIYLDGLEA